MSPLVAEHAIETLSNLKTYLEYENISAIQENKDRILSACDSAIEGLYKQIPTKELITSKTLIFDRKTFYSFCGNCQKEIVSTDYDYCPHCGQKIGVYNKWTTQ